MIGFCSSQGVTDAEGNILSELFPNDAQKRLEELEEGGDLFRHRALLRGAVKGCRSGVRRSH